MKLAAYEPTRRGSANNNRSIKVFTLYSTGVWLVIFKKRKKLQKAWLPENSSGRNEILLGRALSMIGSGRHPRTLRQIRQNHPTNAFLASTAVREHGLSHHLPPADGECVYDDHRLSETVDLRRDAVGEKLSQERVIAKRGGGRKQACRQGKLIARMRLFAAEKTAPGPAKSGKHESHKKR